MKIEFEKQRVFLTGGSRGIGKKIKEIFEKSGAEVIAPTHQQLDLNDLCSIEDYFENDNDFDIFVHCAGINKLAGIEEIDNTIINDVFNVNCFSAIEIIKHISKSMKKKNNGKIVFISSLYAIVSRERRIAYSASKNAITGVMKSLCLELAENNILINSVAPGYVMTDMTKQNLSNEEIDNIKKQIPLGRFQSEEDIANMVVYLCSEYNNSMTGQIIVVDGGFSCR